MVRTVAAVCLVAGLGIAFFGPGQSPTSAGTVVAPNEVGRWIDFIRPDAKESAYRTLGWRMTLQEGIDDAKRVQQPILLWTMNGHPLGCT